MDEIWVTAMTCSECVRHHDEVMDPDTYDPECDCWCHDGDAEDPGDFEWGDDA